MTGLQFIASIVASLAWPSAVVVLVLLLRDPVRRLLLTITRLKYKDLEIDFDRELKQLAQDAKALNVLKASHHFVTKATDSSHDHLAEAERLVDDFPEPAIAAAWSAVEEALLAAVKRLGLLSADVRKSSTLKIMQLLSSTTDIPSGVPDLISRMANLRNMAVHGGGGVLITSDEGREFIALSRGLIENLGNLSKR